MKERSRITVRTAVFVYDCSRLLFLLTLLTAYLGPGPVSMFQDAGGTLPYMMYAAPQALFPLMSFFLLIRFEFSKAYIPLYMTGKILCLLCILVWMFFTIQKMRELPQFMVWSFFISAADIGSIMGMVLLQMQQSASADLPQSADVPQSAGE
jgi:hypothetical protein